MTPLKGLVLGLAAGWLGLPGAIAAPAPAPLAWDNPATQPGAAAAPLALASPAFKADGPIPITYAADGKNVSPALTWSGAPAATRTYVLIMQDPNSDNPRPATHWLAYDIPAAVHALPRGVRNVDAPDHPLGMLQGWNYHASLGYTGPRPPPGEAAHHYHFQLFALDRPLRLKGSAQLPQVIRAMAGHVLARTDLVGLYSAPKPKPETTPPAP